MGHQSSSDSDQEAETTVSRFWINSLDKFSKFVQKYYPKIFTTGWEHRWTAGGQKVYIL